jgi:hypothetical protein
MGMPAIETAHRRSRAGALLILAGLGVLAAAAFLYASGLSRAVAVWALPVGLTAAVFGVASLRGRAVPRWAMIALGAVVAALLLLALVTWLYSLTHQPMST